MNDKIEKQLRDVLGNDAMDALEGLVSNERQEMMRRGAVNSEFMNTIMDGGFRKGEMVIFSASGPTPFVPRDPDIHRGSLYPLIVRPVTQRKSAMALEEAKKAGIGLKVPMEMSDDELQKRVREAAKYLDLNSSYGAHNVYPDSFRRTGRSSHVPFQRPFRIVERRLSLAVKEYIYSIPPKVRYVMKHRPNHPMDPVLMEVGGYSDKVKRQDSNPNRPELPLVGERLSSRLVVKPAPAQHKPWDLAEVRRVIDGVKDGSIPHIKIDSFANLDSHSEFEDKKEQK